MELFYNIHKLFQAVLISGMFISVLFVICSGYLFKKINIQLPLDILCWIMITYASLQLLSIIIGVSTYESYLDRATGPYWWSYLIMLASSSCLPFILLNRKIRSKKFLVFIISIIINCGWLFERYVIIVTSLHRDYAPPGYTTSTSWTSLIPFDLIFFGIIIGLLALLAGNMATRGSRTFILNKN